MKISLNWLSEFMPAPLPDAAAIASRLTSLGIEVEGVEKLGGTFSKVVVGKVVSKEKHPNADRLSVCQVSIVNQDKDSEATGSGGDLLQIVCGAPNVAAGQTVAVALVGAELYTAAGETVVIKKSKIRGVDSNGMICAEDELGLSDHHDGILILDDAYTVGTDFSTYEQRDTVLEISITPNRPDVLSHLGIARELVGSAGLTQLDAPPLSFLPESRRVRIDDIKGCPAYAAVVIEGVKVAPSPLWLQNRLKAVGLRPINNVADITNYVLYAVGRPLHAFDLDKLTGNSVVIRSDVEGNFTTLDRKVRKIERGTVMICDAEKAVAIGGILGGLDSEITDETKNILLESALFNAGSIRKAAKTLGISTDASYRFERGTDAGAVEFGAELATKLILELAGGRVREAVHLAPVEIARKKMTLRPRHARKLLGTAIAAEEMMSILTALGFQVLNQTEHSVEVAAPLYRVDVEAEIDLIEEIARVYGYDRLAASGKLVSAYPEQRDPKSAFSDTLRRMMIGFGFKELLTNPMMPKTDALPFLAEPKTLVETLNPISEEMQAMRPSLLPSLLKTVARNLNLGNRDLQLFEVGSVFEKSDTGTWVSGYREREMLGIVLTGRREPAGWNRKAEASDFFDLKGVVEMLLRSLGLLDKTKFIRYTPNALQVQVSSGGISREPVSSDLSPASIGSISSVPQDLLSRFDIDQAVSIAELDVEMLKKSARFERLYQAPSRYPVVRRDLAFVVEKETMSIEMVAEIEATDALIQRVEIFDVYEGENKGKAGNEDNHTDNTTGKKRSLAFALRLSSKTETLTDEAVSAVVTKVVERMRSRFGAELRDTRK